MQGPHPLHADHQLDSFDCGDRSLNDWLKNRARKNQANNASRTYVVCDDVGAVIGYYCLAAGAVGRADAPSSLQRNRPDPLPVLVLGRLAIHKDRHQAGLGTALLRDAIFRTLQAADITGVTALLVHAISEGAKRFYRSRGFIEFPGEPMTMCLPISTIEKTMAGMVRQPPDEDSR